MLTLLTRASLEEEFNLPKGCNITLGSGCEYGYLIGEQLKSEFKHQFVIGANPEDFESPANDSPVETGSLEMSHETLKKLRSTPKDNAIVYADPITQLPIAAVYLSDVYLEARPLFGASLKNVTGDGQLVSFGLRRNKFGPCGLVVTLALLGGKFYKTPGYLYCERHSIHPIVTSDGKEHLAKFNSIISITDKLVTYLSSLPVDVRFNAETENDFLSFLVGEGSIELLDNTDGEVLDTIELKLV